MPPRLACRCAAERPSATLFVQDQRRVADTRSRFMFTLRRGAPHSRGRTSTTQSGAGGCATVHKRRSQFLENGSWSDHSGSRRICFEPSRRDHRHGSNRVTHLVMVRPRAFGLCNRRKRVPLQCRDRRVIWFLRLSTLAHEDCGMGLGNAACVVRIGVLGLQSPA
jgi:hypothetical protein